MNHVFLHIWPAIDAPLDELTALQATMAPLTRGAGIEEVLVQGRIAAPDGRVHPAAVRFSYQPGAGVVTAVTGARPSDCIRWTTTRRRCCAPAGAAPSTPTSW